MDCTFLMIRASARARARHLTNSAPPTTSCINIADCNSNISIFPFYFIQFLLPLFNSAPSLLAVLFFLALLLVVFSRVFQGCVSWRYNSGELPGMTFMLGTLGSGLQLGLGSPYFPFFPAVTSVLGPGLGLGLGSLYFSFFFSPSDAVCGS